MSCPRDAFGQPACQIVQHPDRPQESFCATCQRRFNPSQEKSATFDWFPMLLGAFAVVLLLVTLSEPPEPQPQPAQNSITQPASDGRS